MEEVVDINVDIGQGRRDGAGTCVGWWGRRGGRRRWGRDGLMLVGWRRGEGNGLEAVGRKRIVGAGEMLIGKIRDRFSRSAEERQGICPSHGQHERKGHQGRKAGKGGEQDAEGGDGGGREPQSVETIGNVQFGHKDRPMAGVGVVNCVQKSEERAAKLHSLGGGQRQGVGVNSRECVVYNDPRAAFALRDHAQWA